MDNLSKHLEILLYIVAYFSGISCITFVFFYSRREQKGIFVRTILFLASTFIYLTINFLQFYKEYFFMSMKMNVLLMLLLDLSMAALVIFWIRLSHQIIQITHISRIYGIVAAISVVYVFGWLAIYLFFTDADYYIYVSFGKDFGTTLDIVFFLGILVNILYLLGNQVRSQNSSLNKAYIILMDGMILLYLGWFYFNDINLINFPYGAELWDIYPYDPVILFAFITNLATMLYYYKKIELPSEIEHESFLSQNDPYHPITLSEVTKKYKLTKREEEIICLVYRGLSNPEISENLCISTSTVKRHMQNIFRKINIRHRSELIHLIKSE